MMRVEEKTHIQNSIGRLVISALSFLLQIAWIFILAKKLNNYSTTIASVSSIMAIIVVIYLYNRTDTPSEFKMPWIILILAFPIAGVCIYFMFGHKKAARKLRIRLEELHKEYSIYIKQDPNVFEEIKNIDMGIANQNRYLIEREGFPVFKNDSVKFYDDAKKAYDEMLYDLLSAKQFIFMEYHAIEESSSLERILNILREKASAGVEVRVFYDDVGSIGFLNGSFARKLNDYNIKCKAFNRVSPAFRLYMNNRDHRKITVIDGKIAYTGGYNLADEYFHLTTPYGYWNDSGIRFTGPAVYSLLGIFLEMWNFTEKESEDISKYLLKSCDEKISIGKGYIQPYADNPLDDSLVGENVYLNVIKNAKKFLYVTTPYLIPGDSMIRELNMAAERGVDVRIITPGIPDKKIVYRITRSYYGQFKESGVKFFEYTPGFMHSKLMVADDEIAVVGTINLDYRSLYHHFENAVLMYMTEAVHDVTLDMKNIISQSREIIPFRKKEKNIILRMFDAALRLIAPLL